MSFQHPAILLLLWILPCVAVLLVYAQRRRAAAARRFIDDAMIARLAPRLDGPRPWVKGTLVILGLALLIVAAARPRFGIYFEKVAQRGVDCFVLLDCSRSMLAEDVAPNRLERAKSDIRDLLKKLAGDRVGLIVFAGKPVLKVPLTADEGFFQMVLDEIDAKSAPRGGTLIGDAIRKAIDAMPPRADHDRVLVLFTDGEDQESYPLEAAKKAAEQGVKIFTVGLGDSTEGARIPVRDAAGKLDYVKEEGREHWSKTNQDVLRQIALATGGAHVPAGTRAYDLGQIYEDHLAGLARGEAEIDGRRKRFHERYQIFLGLAIACLVAETLIPAYPNGKKKNGRSNAVVPILAAAVLFGLPGGQMPSASAATVSNETAQKVEEGIGAFRAGDYKSADTAFSEAEKAAPDEPRIAFDRGCALAAQGESDQALEQFRAATMAKDQTLAASAHYNLGCLAVAKAKARFGAKPEEAAPEVRKEGVETLLQGVDHLRDCLAIDAKHADARHNLEMIRLWIKHMRDVWKQRDSEKDRKDMNLLQFLEMLEKRQRALRTESREAIDAPASPRHRETLRKIEKAQRALADEIEPLKEKIHASAAPPAPNAQTPGTPAGAAPQTLGPDAQKALRLLDGLSDDIRAAMTSAADSLQSGKPAAAVKSQTGAVERIDNVFMAVAPFVDLVKKGIAGQEGLIELSKKGTITSENDNQTTTKNAKDTKGIEKKEETDWSEAAWNQRFIGRYGQVLPAKARRELEQLAKTPAAPTAPPTASPVAKGGAAGNAAEAEQQKKAMEKALQAGVELSPKVVKLSGAAADALDASKPADARPAQEEALELLKKMLPKQDQKQNDKNQQNQDKKDQNKKDKDKKDKNKDQNKKDQDKKDQDKKDQQKKDQDKKDKNEQKKQDQEKKEQDKKDKQDKQQAQPKEDLSKQQAEAALRRARQRQQDRKEMEKALLEKLYRPDKVDKDW